MREGGEFEALIIHSGAIQKSSHSLGFFVHFLLNKKNVKKMVDVLIFREFLSISETDKIEFLKRKIVSKQIYST
jgi:hypothetical protein